ncbi:MAG: glycogen synthase GlgA [Betaproteobacteria bacterium]|nr:glycogen synthase GlgA [Betaproteobacteria bacterium]
MMASKTKLSSLRILFATSEIAPWVKTGGLGDVASALPPALAQAGCDVKVLTPAYPAIRSAFPKAMPWLEVPVLAPQLPSARLLRAGELAKGAELILLDCPAMYERHGNPYADSHGHAWSDNSLRFGLLSRVAHWLSGPGQIPDWQPDILHCNDWHTALAPAFRALLGGGAPTVITVHNLAFTGLFAYDALHALGLPAHSFRYDGVEFHGQLSFLKSGLQFADQITTVSPTYAQEIQTPEFGCGLEGLLHFRANALTGILNGIDETVWDPSLDTHVPLPYSVDALEGKASNKAALQKRLGFEINPDVPLLGMVSRLTHQKGSDLILETADRLIAEGCQLAILGTGERRLEKAFSDLTHRHAHKCMVLIGYDEALAHQIEAGADIFLMPSLFEPCGLNQMYSLRYGTPPVVRRTGGLADTVVNLSPDTLADGSANGFVFDAPDAASLLDAVQRAVAAYRNPTIWRQLQRHGMETHFGWNNAAERYISVYQRALKN